jgi:hypothetical protein
MSTPLKVILTLDSRTTTSISEVRYEMIKDFIVNILRDEKEITLNDLLARAEEQNTTLLGSNTIWYLLKVKQDLEVRKTIKIKRAIGGSRTQIISINKQRNTRSAF